ncbi:MAG TPA: AAA family ATPase [Desulfomonilia bacterium]
MIELLKISSLAVFDEAEIEFGEGLNCITGETGAGKSLIIKALTILMGARTSADLVRTGKDRAVIEALIHNNCGDETVLKREILSTGRSRCYINGELSTLEKLGQVSSGLIHIYGQHEYQDLLSPREQMRILEDIFSLSRQCVFEAYEQLAALNDRLVETQRLIENAAAERADLEHTVLEIESAQIHDNLETELKSALEVALSAQELQEASLRINGMLYSDSRSITDMLSDVKAILTKMLEHDKRVAPSLESISAISTEIEDIAREMLSFSQGYEFDEAGINKLEERLHILTDLKRKYHADEAGLVAIKEKAKESLVLIEDSSQTLEEMRLSLKTGLETYKKNIGEFLLKRLSAAEAFSKGINKDLEDLGMPGTVFKVSQTTAQELDEIFLQNDIRSLAPGQLLEGEFMVSTNVGLDMIPLARAASGGELSRIMLAIKARQKKGTEGSMVFDEIDAGIGGQAAIMIADKLKSLSEKSQAIIVTHLHQVASSADSHLVVEKNIKNGETFSSVKTVKGDERVAELARMMGGEAPGEALIRHARKLVKNSR